MRVGMFIDIYSTCMDCNLVKNVSKFTYASAWVQIMYHHHEDYIRDFIEYVYLQPHHIFDERIIE